MKPRLQICTCGSCHHPEWSCMTGGRLTSVEFPAHFALIDHPSHGLMLFDTGYASHIKDASRRWPYRLYSTVLPFEIPLGQELVTQLAAKGFKKEDIKWIIISHFHPDHIGGLKDFPDAQFICSKEALEALQHLAGWKALKQAFLPDLLPVDTWKRARWIEDAADIEVGDILPGFNYGKDLFGDGSLIAISLPGHAFGQYGLYLPTPSNAQNTFLVADACWRSESYRRFVLPPNLVMSLLPLPQAYRDTLKRIHELSLLRPDIKIVPSHCDEIKASSEWG